MPDLLADNPHVPEVLAAGRVCFRSSCSCGWQAVAADVTLVGAAESFREHLRAVGVRERATALRVGTVAEVS